MSEADRQAGALERALRRKVRGEVRFDAGSRALYATDASNYRQPPIGVVVPRDLDDVVHAVAVARQYDVPVLSRGGGTSLAGQCCNVALVLDFSKHLDRVLAIDPDRRTARVQPGCVADDLRAAAQAHGLDYGAYPATHTHCTLGGMIGNNSCGVHSVQSEFYGPGPRTEDHVVSLDVLTWRGQQLSVGATDPGALRTRIAAGGEQGALYAQLRDLAAAYADDIRAGFPDIPRRVSGYNLPALLPENGFDVAKALVGTESTCVTLLEATVALGRHFPKRALLVLGYPDVYAAGDHIPEIRALRPVGCEGIDSHLVEFIREKGLHAEHLRLLPEGAGWLLVEFGADRQAEADDRARAAMGALAGRDDAPTMKLITEPAEQSCLWQIRESGLGATAFVPGEPDAWPGWEDSAVPPDRIGDYLRDLRHLFERFGYQAALYGHFAQGCVHCRISFDLQTAGGIRQYAAFTAEAADLVVRYGGSLSGEHGDGQARGDLLERMYGPRLMEAMRTFKQIWDPDGRMNPGKVIDPRPRTADLRLGPHYRPWEPKTRFAFSADEHRFSRAALRCVGVGKCRRKSGGTMCPSYMVTREEKHSTRGRAHLLWEMLQGDVITEGWRSEEVKDALELCLACKGCKGDCPVNVDLGTYKAEFLSHYYEKKRRPRQAWAFGLIHRWARLGARLPRLANFVTHAPGLRALAKLTAGIAPERHIPRFAPHTFREWFEARPDRPTAGRPVLLWIDTFNNYFFPGVLSAAVEALEHAGCAVRIAPRPLCCGRPLYDFGMLDRARAQLAEILEVLGDEIDAGTAFVGVEPSCVATFRDELPDLLAGDERAKRLSGQFFTLGELLTREIEGYRPPRLEGRRALVHGHCHHQAIMGLDGELDLLRAMGLTLDTPATGCCGMAGAFGFERGEKYRVSIAAGERLLLPAVREAAESTLIVADGFSCREQVRQTTSRSPLHLAQVVQLALHQAELRDLPEPPEVAALRLEPPAFVEKPHDRAAAAAALLGAGGLLSWWLLT